MSKPKSDAQIVTERGTLYGDWGLNHDSLGKAWTGLLQQHYGIVLDHDIPGWLAALMTVQLKLGRAAVAGVHHDDNFVDARNYLEFARRMQCEAVRENKGGGE